MSLNEVPIDMERVTRFELLDEQGRAYSRWPARVDLMFQDNGETLKVFINANWEDNTDVMVTEVGADDNE